MNDTQINLFGEEVEIKEQEPKKGGRQRYKTMQEIHGYTPGQTCGSCEYCEQHSYSRNYYKCSQWIVSASAATDIRLKNPACGIWKPVK
jgi:hypothetical protein